MQVSRLKASYFRNFINLDLKFSPHFNFIYGDNGSGKSSLLEAIYFLSLGRSFRSTLSSRAIHYTANKFNLFSFVLKNSINITLGLEKTRHGNTRIKMDNNTITISDLVKLLPMQFISPNSYHLLSGGPKARRQFIDWGVFHVEPGFFLIWQQFQLVLKQRNAALQQKLTTKEINIWDDKLIELSITITQMRQKYLQLLIPLILELINKLVNLNDLRIEFYQGWSNKSTLEYILNQSYLRDSCLGYTQYGPHRADLLIKLRDNLVFEVLSRGEQKLLTYALQLAQGLLLKKLTDKSCIYLFDDLFAELDSIKQEFLLDLLNILEAQVFVTVINNSAIKKLDNTINSVFFQAKNGIVIEK